MEVEIQSFLTSELVTSDRFTPEELQIYVLNRRLVGPRRLEVLENSENLLLLPAFEIASSRSAMGKEVCCVITVQPTRACINQKSTKKT